MSVGSLPYSDAFVSDVIIEVPGESATLQVTAPTNEEVDLYRFTKRFDYGDSDDDDCESGKSVVKGKGHSIESDSIKPEVTKESVSCSVIECMIGDKLFRIEASGDAPSRFIEVIVKESFKLGVPSRKRKL